MTIEGRPLHLPTVIAGLVPAIHFAGMRSMPLIPLIPAIGNCAIISPSLRAGGLQAISGGGSGVVDRFTTGSGPAAPRRAIKGRGSGAVPKSRVPRRLCLALTLIQGQNRLGTPSMPHKPEAILPAGASPCLQRGSV